MKWLLCLAATGCIANVDGDVRSTGGALGAWRWHPTMCRNGDAREFLGADLSDGKIDLRLVDDPSKGYALVIALGNDPAYPTAVLYPQSCTRFDASTTDNDDGNFQIDCPLPGGGLSGSASYSDCKDDFGP
jgi:hypothetical protein